MRAVEYLADRGFSGITCYLSKSYERQSGMQEDVETYQAFARTEEGKCWQITLVITKCVFKPIQHLVKQDEIDPQTYWVNIKNAGGIVDTLEWREKRASTLQRLLEIETELQRIEPKCPVCGAVMVRRENRRTRQPFYGCKKYPKCNGTRVYNKELSRRIDCLDKERCKLTQ